MNKKFDFLSNLDEKKQRYQVYEAVIGFEKAKVLIPLESAEEFEKLANDKQPKSVSGLKKLAESFGGEVQ